MGDIYAIEEDTGKRVLVRTECDFCTASIKPNPQIAESGWVVKGWQEKFGGEIHELNYCPSCWELYGD